MRKIEKINWPKYNFTINEFLACNEFKETKGYQLLKEALKNGELIIVGKENRMHREGVNARIYRKKETEPSVKGEIEKLL